MILEPEIEIAGKKIGKNYPPYVIAEMSANHNGEIASAYRLIEVAYRMGADAVKMQTYKPSTITLDCRSDNFLIKEGLWSGRYLYDLYEEAHTPWDWHRGLFDYAATLGITIFSSPFDSTAVDLLEDLNTPAYKIASFEAVDLPLIKYVAATKKPLIISTGMASEIEISEAVEVAYEGGCSQLALLRCVSGYPAPADQYNLSTITDMRAKYGLVTGLSDHTISNVTAIASVALGASIIEKHFTLDRSGGGPDDSFSLEPAQLADLCLSTKEAWSAIGAVDYGFKSIEKTSIQHRRSLYFVKNLKSGDVITADSIRSVRPGNGLQPKYLEKLIGLKVNQEVFHGTPTSAVVIEGLDLS
jgi:pseudaminic acid synthase